MEDLEFIKKFSKITVSGACKKTKVDRAGLLTNRLKDEKAKILEITVAGVPKSRCARFKKFLRI